MNNALEQKIWDAAMCSACHPERTVFDKSLREKSKTKNVQMKKTAEFETTGKGGRSVGLVLNPEGRSVTDKGERYTWKKNSRKGASEIQQWPKNRTWYSLGMKLKRG